VYSTVNRIIHFSYFYPDYPISGLTVTGLARVSVHPFIDPPYVMLLRRWEDNANIDLKEIEGQVVVDWSQVAEDREQWWAFVNRVMNLRVPLNAANFLSS
jgi:hypothetical protein